MIMEAMRADITSLHVDAIVNAANSTLLGGGGVDGAIHKVAGAELLEACKKIRATQWPDGLPVGEAVATPGFHLPARWVIHTVGPNRHRGQTDPALLANAFRNSAECAARLGAQTIAFPAISGGVYGWDMHDVARIAVNTLHSWVPKNGATLPRTIIFALFSGEAKQIFHDELGRLPSKIALS